MSSLWSKNRHPSPPKQIRSRVQAVAHRVAQGGVQRLLQTVLGAKPRDAASIRVSNQDAAPLWRRLTYRWQTWFAA
jgi:hypothetical protein